MLHGNAKNRWFDKCFQLIVSKNGKASVNFEHAWGDGVAVLRFFNEIFQVSKNLEGEGVGGEATSSASPSVTELKFDLTPNLQQVISEAETAAGKFMNSLEFARVETDALGKAFCKENKVGADGCLQMSFQLAHYLMHNSIKATYESASTSTFKHGRTETIRSATKEAKEFAETFARGASMSEKKAALLKAVKNHGRITKAALTGRGIDRHLFALRVWPPHLFSSVSSLFHR